jgi:two-component system, LuxR family, response regulator FixJ
LIATKAVHVVDDDDAVRDSIEALLLASGYPTTTHSSGPSFFRHYAPESALCVILDVYMPGMDGLEVQERIVSLGDAPPVIMVTGHGDVSMAVRAMKAGAFDFVEKPFNPKTLIERVEAAARWAEASRAERQRAEDAHARLGALTPREMDVLKQLLIGHPNKVIARELGLSPRTVEVHRARVMEKTGAESLSHLVRMAIAAGLDFQL